MTYNVSSTCNTHPATAIRGKLLVALGAMSAFGPVTTDIYLPSLPQAAAALNTTPTGIQSSLTVCLLGVAAGQLIAGPLSDSRGRRGPLLAAMAIFTLSSALCSTAANIATLDLFRLLQGGAGGAGIAICFAIVRDLCAGSAAARAYSILLAVSLVALIVAPTIGGQLLQITDWHGVFLTLTGLGLILLCCAYNWIPETLPIARRATGGLATTMAALRQVTTDPGFTGYALTGGFSFAALFAYISAAPFIFEGPYHMSPQLFAALMALNGTGIVLANIVNARLLRRFSPLTMLDLGLAGVAVGATGVLLVLATTPHHLYTLLTPLFLMVASYGLTRPNSAALALDRHPDAAGSAAAIFGLILFAVGAIAAPATGLHQHNTISLGATVTTAAALAILARIMTWRTHHKPHHPPPQQPKTHQPTTNPHNPTTHHSNSQFSGRRFRSSELAMQDARLRRAMPICSPGPLQAALDVDGMAVMLLTLADYERAAEARLHRPVWDFIAGGAGEDGTVQANRCAFASWRFRPRVATDVSAMNTSTTLLGYCWQAPIAIAPTALHQLCTPDGELASAAAAAAAGLPFVVSMYASRTIEELAHASPLAMLWQQLYLLKDRAVTASVAERAEAAGAGALVVTIDSPWLGRRHRDLRGMFTLPPGVQPRNVAPSMESGPDFSSPAAHAAQTMDPALTWKDITWLTGLTGLPVVCKGVQTGEDAIAAREAGAAAVIVSNHGGRQLEGARATLDALPEVVAAVGPDFPVLMDGGIRSGRDVLVTLALGAAAVLVGRPVLHGLTVADAAGATAVLTILIDELVDAMGHCGRPNLDSIGPDLVTPATAALMTPRSITAPAADTDTSTTTYRNSESTPAGSSSVFHYQRKDSQLNGTSVVCGDVPDLPRPIRSVVERAGCGWRASSAVSDSP